MDKKLSIVIPIYNGEKYINSIMDCINNQSFSDFEVILINDGSTDNSAAICDELAKKNNRINVIHSVNKGVSAARNTGIQAAVGEYIAFWDCDDTFLPTTLEMMLDRAQKTDKTLVVCGIKKVFADGREESNSENIKSPLLKVEEFALFYKEGLLSNPCNKIFKRSIIIDNNIKFDPKISMGEDLLFVLDYLKYVDTISYIKDELYRYSISSVNSLHTRFHENRYLGISLMYNSMMELAENNGKNREMIKIMKLCILDEYSLALSDCVHEANHWSIRENIKLMANVFKSKEYNEALEEIDSATILPVLKKIMRLKISLLAYIYFTISKIRARNS